MAMLKVKEVAERLRVSHDVVIRRDCLLRPMAGGRYEGVRRAHHNMYMLPPPLGEHYHETAVRAGTLANEPWLGVALLHNPLIVA